MATYRNKINLRKREVSDRSPATRSLFLINMTMKLLIAENSMAFHHADTYTWCSPSQETGPSCGQIVQSSEGERQILDSLNKDKL